MGRTTAKDSARFSIAHDLGGLECLSATYVEHRFAPHVHEEFVIGVIQAGAQGVRYRGSNQIMPERTTCVMNPDEMHTGHAAVERGWTYRVIYPHPSVLRSIAQQVVGHPVDVPYFDELVFPDDHVTRLLLDLHDSLDCAAATPLARQSLLLQALSQLVLRHAAPRPCLPRRRIARPGIVRAREYLDALHARPVALDELAGVACMSPYHFVRSFSADVGMPPHVYQLGRRIGAAKALLAGDTPLAEIAAATGFADQSHLTNRFRTVVGVTPGVYRKKSKNLQDAPEQPEAESA